MPLGVWHDNTNTFQFKLPAGVCAADVTFMDTTGIHEFILLWAVLKPPM